ncbi:MAG TPA: hypothetical protein VI485_14345 [Vicinamibacterales bacterium]|nr:hypothetical protein [Vicinamibacterales bacterium]
MSRASAWRGLLERPDVRVIAPGDTQGRQRRAARGDPLLSKGAEGIA